MDYKELAKELRDEAQWQNINFTFSTVAKELYAAATAIETLLAERDAAVEDLRGRCWCCVHGKPWEPAGPLSKLTGCDHLSEFGVLARGGGKCKCPHWEWRGPQDAVPESDTT